MEIRPILSSLRRHKTAAALIVLEVALTCAIVCNAFFLVGSAVERIQRDSGLAEDTIVRVQVAGIGRNANALAQTATDIAALRALPGVLSATATNQLPYDGSSWNSGVNLKPDQDVNTLNASVYMADEQFLDTLGLQVAEGRNFNADEFRSWRTEGSGVDGDIPAAIITRGMAEALYPGETAVGKDLYSWGDVPTHIVGVVEHLARPNQVGGDNQSRYAMIFPVHVPYTIGRYVVRTDPTRRAEVLQAAVEALNRVNPNRIITRQNTLTEMRTKYHSRDRVLAWAMVIVCAMLLLITALGIVGLASFWVQQRTRQIGVRRALGATRGQILRYFQTENFVLVGLGIVLGLVLAFGINQLLMAKAELPRLPIAYAPAAGLVLLLLGQLAVLGPARRAAAVPPAIATRSA